LFGLEKLGTDLNGAVLANGSTDTLAAKISEVLLGWLGGTIFYVFTSFLIFGVVLFVFYGAFLYFTAYGDENRATRAKKTLMYAMIGLVIALTSFAATSYVQRILINKATEEELLKTQSQPVAPVTKPITNPGP
jgi:hypothetical protein